MDDPSKEAAAGAAGRVPTPRPQPVLYELDAPIALVTLNRPERRNAINDEIVTGLHAALDRALDDVEVRAVVLTGAGNSFSSGVDLKEAAEHQDRPFEEYLADADSLARLFRRLRSFEKVTIAAVNGPALASGCGLATLCDFTLATGAARFGYPEVRAGFVPTVVSVYLRSLLPEKRLRDLLLTGRLLSADEAHEFGLVSEVVAADDLLARCRQIGEQIAQNAPLAIQVTKEFLEKLPGLDIDRALRTAVDYNARVRGGEECREGVQAFLEKREPVWSGDEAEPAPAADDAPEEEAAADE